MQQLFCNKLFWALPIFSLCFLLLNNGVFVVQAFRIKTGESSRLKWSTSSTSLLNKTAKNIHVDPQAIKIASNDYGEIVQQIPVGVLSPSGVSDIVDAIKLSYNCPVPFKIAARGNGHSVRGQAMAKNGIVVEMSALNLNNTNRLSANVSWSPELRQFYADVGGEQLWMNVLRKTLEYGLAPVSWTDYLYLTVGGTLSNAGISGQSHRFGPQISNVYEMDVITGKGEVMTCSKQMNSELFYAVLGGLGQFGIITRARIALDKAPTRVKWLRMFYKDFSTFSRDQEYLISDNRTDYLEGFVVLENSIWNSSFYTPSDQSKISSLLSKQKITYFIEAVKYYDNQTANTVDKELDDLLRGLNYIPGFNFERDETFLNFLSRVPSEELEPQSKGPRGVHHPWLNLMLPKSDIMEFNDGVFVNILLKQGLPNGILIVYPLVKNKWDDQMSAVIPGEEIFYTVGILQEARNETWKILDDQNQQILDFCHKAGIKIKQYLPHYETREEWMNHFGPKWSKFAERKARFDPKKILSPGQRIFN